MTHASRLVAASSALLLAAAFIACSDDAPPEPSGTTETTVSAPPSSEPPSSEPPSGEPPSSEPPSSEPPSSEPPSSEPPSSEPPSSAPPSPGEGNSILRLTSRIGDGGGMKATRDCAVVDMTVGIRRMEASTTQIRRGDTDDIEWHLLFESAEPTKRLSEIDVEVALPYGEYISYRMLSGSGWILHVECDGTPFELVIEEPGDDPAEYQYSSNHGAWDLDEDGRFINGAPGEILGGFEIRPGIVTNAVWQNNLTRMVWFDNDDSGTWSEGDNFEFVLDEGVIYMAEMVVTYERDGEILPPDDEEPVPELYVDAATGLMWENDHQAILRPYADALAYCQDLDLAGHADWRVPTVDELRTLIVGCADTVTGGACACGDDATDYAECMGSCEGCWAWEGPADGCYWPADLAGICHRHWTSTAAHVDWDPDGSYVFGIGFLQGAIDVYNTGTEGRFSFVRCVRD